MLHVGVWLVCGMCVYNVHMQVYYTSTLNASVDIVASASKGVVLTVVSCTCET